MQDDGTAQRYTHELTIAQCAHKHLVCKDCGAMVQPVTTVAVSPNSIGPTLGNGPEQTAFLQENDGALTPADPPHV